MIIREYKENDTEVIVALFTETVRKVNIQDYSSDQVEVWAPIEADLTKWKVRLNKSMTFVAEDGQNIIGFAQLEASGHIDCFYIAHNRINTGIGSRLLKAIEDRAAQLKINRIFTEASITAKPFFQHKGFLVIKQQIVELRNTKFVNYSMEKQLT